MSEEFKCPYCEGIATVAYNNLLYCHDCKRTFSERDAKIMKQAARIAELEAELDRLREALKEIVMLSTVDQVCNNCRHCQKLRNMDWCAWYCNAVDDSSTQGCRKFEMAGFHNSDVHTIARKALKGAEQEVE